MKSCYFWISCTDDTICSGQQTQLKSSDCQTYVLYFFVQPNRNSYCRVDGHRFVQYKVKYAELRENVYCPDSPFLSDIILHKILILLVNTTCQG